MSAAGFEYIRPTIVADTTSPQERYGLWDVEAASNRGYRSSRADAPSEDSFLPKARRDEYLRALVGNESPEEVVEVLDPRARGRKVLGSFSRGGCLAEAERAVFGDWARYTGLQMALDDIQAEAMTVGRRSDPVRRAVEAWSSCMREMGYEVEEPEELTNRDWGDAVTDEEKVTATADAGCRKSSKLNLQWSHEEARAQSELLADDPGLPKDYADMWAAAVQRAGR